MYTSMRSIPVSRPTRWAGYLISTLPVLFLIFDGVTKLLHVPLVVEAFAQLGYPEHLALGIGLLELVCVAVYLVPRTALLGAIVLTGYLGGAVATHVRSESPLFPVVFPIVLGALLWGGLVMRDARLRTLLLRG